MTREHLRSVVQEAQENELLSVSPTAYPESETRGAVEIMDRYFALGDITPRSAVNLARLVIHAIQPGSQEEQLRRDRDEWKATTETWEDPEIRYALMSQRDRWRSLRVLLREIVSDWFDRRWRRSGRSIIQRPKGEA